MQGYDALYVGDVFKGAKDVQVLEKAEIDNRILITNDKDFGELIFKRKMRSGGVVLLRLEDDYPDSRVKHVLRLLNNFSDKIAGNFVIVSENKVRIKKIISRAFDFIAEKTMLESAWDTQAAP